LVYPPKDQILTCKIKEEKVETCPTEAFASATRATRAPGGERQILPHQEQGRAARTAKLGRMTNRNDGGWRLSTTCFKARNSAPAKVSKSSADKHIVLNSFIECRTGFCQETYTLEPIGDYCDYPGCKRQPTLDSSSRSALCKLHTVDAVPLQHGSNPSKARSILTRAQLQHQAKSFAATSRCGDFLAFKHPGATKGSYSLGMVWSGPSVLESATETVVGGEVDSGSEVMFLKQVKVLRAGGFCFQVAKGDAFPVDIHRIAGTKVNLELIHHPGTRGVVDFTYRLHPKEHQRIQSYTNGSGCGLG